MRLIDARRVAVRTRARIRFPLSGGMECVIDEHGVARVPGLQATPDFNLEEEFSRATRFNLERPGEPLRSANRQDLEAAAGAGKTTASAPPED